MIGLLAQSGGSDLLDQLLGLTRLSLSDERATLGWRYALPLWAWLLLAAAAAGCAWWSYHRLIGKVWVRTVLAAVRTLTILFIIALLAGPMLVVTQEIVTPDWLLVLVDRSASMRIADMSADGSPTGALTERDAAMLEALGEQAYVFDDEHLGKQRQIVWLGFDAMTYPIDPPFVAPGLLGEAQGEATNLRTAIDQALQRAAGRPISGIVLLTDGRSPQATGVDLVRRLKQHAVGVYSVPLGANDPPMDLAIGQVDAPDKAFVRDTIPVSVAIDHYPFDGVVDPAAVSVRLVDKATGEVLDEQPPVDGDISRPIRLTTETTREGPVEWRVELVYTPDDGRAELITDNNSRDIAVQVIDRPIRVLYVEGYPRWEYRYLKTMLIREKSISSSMMLRSADRAFAQEGDEPLTRLPNTAEEFEPYDVIILGDVPSDYFSTDQLSIMRDHVSINGAGVMWIGGQYATPRSYANTPLGALLPMTQPITVDRLDPAVGPVFVRPTALAEALSIMQLQAPEEQDAKWPSTLPGLLWLQDPGPLKPTAEVLAETYSDAGTLAPLVTRMRFGAGQSLYVASDDTWRWRYGRGELYYEQFWMQMVRMLGRNRIQQDTDRVRLRLSNRRVQVRQPVVLTLTVKDEMLIARDLPRITVTVLRLDPETGRLGEQVATLELQRKKAASETFVGGVQYETTWQPGTSGSFAFRIDEAALDDAELANTIEVIRSDDELRNPAADHDRLATLAEQTGGAVIDLASLGELENLVPPRAIKTPNDITEPLWDSWLALLLAGVLLTAEWLGRKAIRLV